MIRFAPCRLHKMLAILTKIIDRLLWCPSVANGMAWSLGLHAALFAAAYGWWSGPANRVSFAGSRFAVQIEATFSEMPPARAIETTIDLESAPPLQPIADESEIELGPPTVLVEVPQAEHPLIQDEIVIGLPSLPLPDRPTEDDDFCEAVEAESQHNTEVPEELYENEPVEMPEPAQHRNIEPPTERAIAVAEQFAGVEEKVSPDFSGNPPPTYPAEAIRGRLEGLVLLRLHITADGQMDRVEIAKSSGHTVLDRAAAEAVSRWHARPAKRRGQPVGSVEILPIRFRL